MVLDRSKKARLTPQSDKRRYLETAPGAWKITCLSDVRDITSAGMAPLFRIERHRRFFAVWNRKKARL